MSENTYTDLSIEEIDELRGQTPSSFHNASCGIPMGVIKSFTPICMTKLEFRHEPKFYL